MSANEFLRARAALDAGDLDALATVLDEHPDVLRYRHFAGEWYESGYFAGASLLHHVAGNPIRCPLPGNVLEVTRLLLERGADPEARCGADRESTLAGLLLTSKQASDAGVAVPLLEMLLDAGVSIDLDSPGVLTYPLWNAAPGTAEALVRRGTPMALPHAAGLGRIDVLEELLARDPGAELVEEALILAAVRGELESARLLVRHGARGDRLGQHGPATALHEAANRGYPEIVALLLENGADSTVRDRRWNGTALGWAEHGHPEHLATMRALLGERKD
jgi:ankyrin repeat protein